MTLGVQSDLSVEIWHLRRFNVLDQLSRDELERMTRVLEMREYGKKDIIYLPNDDQARIFFLMKGRVKIVRVDPDTGKELILYLIKPGEPFGLMSIGDKRYAGTSARALQRCLVGYIPWDEFQRMLANNNFCMDVNKLVGERMVRIENRLEELLFRTVPCRLARLLLRLSEEFPLRTEVSSTGSKAEVRLGINVDLTQQDLANLVGATREITSTTLNDFKREGWIDTERKRVWVRDRRALEEIAS